MHADSRSVSAPATHEPPRTFGPWIWLSIVACVAIGALLMVAPLREHPFEASRMSPTERERAATTLEALQQWGRQEDTKDANTAQRVRTALQEAGAVFSAKLVPAGTPQLPAPTGFAHLSFGMPKDGLPRKNASLEGIGNIYYDFDPQTDTLQEFKLYYRDLELPAMDFYATLVERFGAPSEIGEFTLEITWMSGTYGGGRQEVRWHWPEDVDVILDVQTTLRSDSFRPCVTFAKGRQARALTAAAADAKQKQAEAAERASALARLKNAQ